MTQPIDRINVGHRLSDVSIFNQVAYLAGQVPEETIDLGIKEQTAEVLAIIDRLLAQAGSDKSRILSCQIFLRDIAEISGMNEVWDRWVAAGHCPSRATVQAQLAEPRWRIEIVLTAALASQYPAAV
ncbi:MAG TPA: RidA family protein [Ramlibacter sp.]|nr:RidA family protein [Ramlibacter sp.]